MLHANPMAQCFMAGIRDFLPFLLIDPMIFIYELDPYSLEIIREVRK